MSADRDGGLEAMEQVEAQAGDAGDARAVEADWREALDVELVMAGAEGDEGIPAATSRLLAALDGAGLRGAGLPCG